MKFSQKHRPMILRHAAGDIVHPTYGTVKLSLSMNGAMIFEFPTGDYFIAGWKEAADELFRQLDNSELKLTEGGPRP